MSSAPESFAEGSVLQHYRLVERLGGAAQTWLAEDTRRGKKAAIKILSRLLPKDKATRDMMLKQLRLKAALSHPGVANTLQIDIDQDALWMASELVEGESLTSRAEREKASRQSFLRYAWQMADALAAVHSAGIVLGQITGGSWILTPDNDVRLAGFRFSSFMGKHETGQTLLSSFKPANMREAGYLSPEQVAGKMVTSRADIFALGVCLYELIAGTLPFQGTTVADIAQAIATAAPPAPQNPAIDRAMLGPIGRCIHKSPDSRYEKIALLKDDLAKLAPEAETLARRRAVTSPGGVFVPKKPAAAAAATFLVVGELPYHELLRGKDPARAGRLENTMQQYLGEAVYLFDGKVLDSLGPVIVASLPDGASAIKAAQKGLADLVEHNMTHGDEPVEPRMLIHHGELVPTAGRPEGSGLTTARSVLEAMEPLQLLVSKPVIDRVDVDGEPVLVGRLAEIDFYRAPQLREPEPEVPVAPIAAAGVSPAAAPRTASAASPPAPSAPAAVSEVAEPAVPAAKKKGLPLALVGIAAVLVLVIGAAAAVYTLKLGRDEAPVTPIVTPTRSEVRTVAVNPDRIHFEAVRVELPPTPAVEEATGDEEPGLTAAPAPDAETMGASVGDVELESVALEIRAGVEALLALDRTLQLVPDPAEDARTIGARLARTPEGIVLVPRVSERGVESEADAIAVAGTSAAAVAYVKQTWARLGRDLSFLPGDDATMGSYLDARSLERRGEHAGALAAITRVTGVQTDFVPGLRLRMRVLRALGRNDEAIEMARRVAVLDPLDAGIRKDLADWELARGNPGQGLVWLGALLEIDRNNVEALTRVGMYAAAVGNEERFRAALARLAPLSKENPRLSEGDIILYRGRLDAAARTYYEDLDTQPENPVLALKIGRIAVLRRSDEVLKAELAKLQRLDAPFELALLEAYIAANNGNAEGASLALLRAEATASPLDAVYTASAEVYLLLNRQQQVLEALQKAIARSEPTHDYIQYNPVFGYLGRDPKFRGVLQRLGEQRENIAAALDGISL